MDTFVSKEYIYSCGATYATKEIFVSKNPFKEYACIGKHICARRIFVVMPQLTSPNRDSHIKECGCVKHNICSRAATDVTEQYFK